MISYQSSDEEVEKHVAKLIVDSEKLRSGFFNSFLGWLVLLFQCAQTVRFMEIPLTTGTELSEYMLGWGMAIMLISEGAQKRVRARDGAAVGEYLRRHDSTPAAVQSKVRDLRTEHARGMEFVLPILIVMFFVYVVFWLR